LSNALVTIHGRKIAFSSFSIIPGFPTLFARRLARTLLLLVVTEIMKYSTVSHCVIYEVLHLIKEYICWT
jgi:hypothetical protein